MIAERTAHVRMLAALHSLRRDSGRPVSLDVEVPAEGIPALSLAEELGLPAGLVEGLFLNHTVAGTDALVRPGDRVAFVPQGTPASHPSFFGAFVTRG